MDNYTNQPQMLSQALSHSLATYLARDGEEVVGLVRLIGDGFFFGFCPGFDCFAYLSAPGDWQRLDERGFRRLQRCLSSPAGDRPDRKNLGILSFTGV